MTKSAVGTEAIPFRRERILAAGVLSLLAPLPLAVNDSVALPAYVLWTVLFALHLAFVRKGKILVLPNWALNLLGVVAVVLVVRYRHGLRSLLKAALLLLLITTLAKFASIRRERDLSVALWLSAFLFVGSLATSFHVSILVFVAVYLVLGWTVLVRWSVWRELADAPAEWSRPGAGELPAFRHVVSAVGAVVLVAIPFFLLLPRTRAPYLHGIRAEAREIWTGFSESVDPGMKGELKLSERVYVRLEADGSRAASSLPTLRLRILAFARWDGKTWSKPAERGRPLPARADLFVSLAAPRERSSGGTGTVFVDLLPLRSRYLAVPVNALGIRLAGSSQRRTGFWLERDALADVLVPFRPEESLQYEVLVGEEPTVDRVPPVPDDPSAVAPGSAAVRRFVLETAGDPARVGAEEVAANLERYLSTRFEYSLEAPLLGERPVEEFLFRQRRGHCEAFATSMAVGLREAGIPARLVTGFLGAEVGLFGNTWLVRGKNAHAWVEAWCGPEKGWLLFDPTPAAGRPSLERASWLRQLRNAGENAEFFYDRWVLSFGESDQGDLVRRFRDAVEAFSEALGRLASGLRRSGPALPAVALALAALLLAVALRNARVGRPLLALGGPSAPPGLLAYKKLRRRLGRQGVRVSPATAPGEALLAVTAFGPRAAELARQLVTAYAAASFGGIEPPPGERERVEALWKELKPLLVLKGLA